MVEGLIRAAETAEAAASVSQYEARRARGSRDIERQRLCEVAANTATSLAQMFRRMADDEVTGEYDLFPGRAGGAKS